MKYKTGKNFNYRYIKQDCRKTCDCMEKAKSADGYEIYRRAGTTNPYVRAAVIKSGSTTKYTNAKLKKGHTYYYRIRSYRYDENGRKIYSGWSTVKKQKVK